MYWLCSRCSLWQHLPTAFAYFFGRSRIFYFPHSECPRPSRFLGSSGEEKQTHFFAITWETCNQPLRLLPCLKTGFQTNNRLVRERTRWRNESRRLLTRGENEEGQTFSSQQLRHRNGHSYFLCVCFDNGVHSARYCNSHFTYTIFETVGTGYFILSSPPAGVPCQSDDNEISRSNKIHFFSFVLFFFNLIYVLFSGLTFAPLFSAN